MNTLSIMRELVNEAKRLKKAYRSEMLLASGMLLLSLLSFAGGYLTARE
ncbi:MAG: hypothetical protein Q7S63_01590 [bacterium]|nr:hypothetical protein [bacterium]